MTLITIAQEDLVEYHGDLVPAEFRLYANKSFRTSAGVFVAKGSPEEDGSFYQAFGASEVSDAIRIAVGTAHSTTDSVDHPDVTYRGIAFDAAGHLIKEVFSGLRIPPEADPTTWAALQAYSRGRFQRYPSTYLDSNAIVALIAAMIGGIPPSGGGFDPTLAADHSNSLTAAISAIGATETDLYLDANFTASADVTVPANVRLKFLEGSMMTVPAGVTVTILSAFDHPNDKIFDGDGDVRFGAGAISAYRTAWWTGPEMDQNIDAALTRAITACAWSNTGEIIVPNCRWQSEGNISLNHGTILIKGEGVQPVGNLLDFGGPCIVLTQPNRPIFDVTTLYTQQVFFENIVLDASGVAGGIGVRFQGAAGSIGSVGAVGFRNCTISGRSIAVQFTDGVNLGMYASQVSFDADCKLFVAPAADGGIAGLHIDMWNTDIEFDGDILVGHGANAVLADRCGIANFNGAEFAGMAAVYGSFQVEQQLVASPGGITVDGNARVVITKAGIATITIDVPLTVAVHNTAAKIATAIRKAIASDPAVVFNYQVGGQVTTNEIILKPVLFFADDPTFNFSIANLTCAGITDSLVSTKLVNGGLQIAANAVVQVGNMAGGSMQLNFLGCQEEGFDYVLDYQSGFNPHTFNFEGGILQGAFNIEGVGNANISIFGARVFPKTVQFQPGTSSKVVCGRNVFINNDGRFWESRISNWNGTGGMIEDHDAQTAVDDSYGAFSRDHQVDPMMSLPKRLKVYKRPAGFDIPGPRIEAATAIDYPNDPILRLGVHDTQGKFLFGYDVTRRFDNGWLKFTGNQGSPFDGLETTAFRTGASFLTGPMVRETVNALTSNPAVNIPCALADIFTLTPGHDLTISTSGPVNGQRFTVAITQVGTTSRLINWDAADFRGVENFYTGIVSGVVYKFEFEVRGGIAELVGKSSSNGRYNLGAAYTPFLSTEPLLSMGSDAALSVGAHWVPQQNRFTVNSAGVGGFKISEYTYLGSTGNGAGNAYYGKYINLDLDHSGVADSAIGLFSFVNADFPVTEIAGGIFNAAHGSSNADGIQKIFGVRGVATGNHLGSISTPLCIGVDGEFNTASGVGPNDIGIGVRGRVNMSGTGDVVEVRGLSISDWTDTGPMGTVEQAYAIYIDSSINNFADDTYAIYSQSHASSFLNGPLRVDSTNKDFSETRGFSALSQFLGVTAGNVNYGGYFEGITSVVANEVYGINAQSAANGGVAITSAYGGRFASTVSTDGTTVTNHKGVESSLAVLNNPTLTRMIGFDSLMLKFGGTVTDMIGIRFSSWSGTATNSYAVYIAADTNRAPAGSAWSVYSLSTAPSFWTGKLMFNTTVTAGGVTGAATINKPSGTVNFAAGTNSLVVTNSFCSVDSIVWCVIRTNDATALIKNVVPAAGSFTINLNANATAETSVGFVVMN